MDDIDGRIITT